VRFTTVIISAVIFVAPAVAKAAPQQLYGKSVIITMSESRTSRPVGGGPATDATASSKMSVYISEAGRTFVRSDRTLYRGGRRGAESKAIDTGPGGGAVGVAVAGNVQFSGNTMTVNMQMASGARRVTATFDSSFSGCTGSVINGREGGKAMVIKNRYTGENREVLAIQSSVSGCSVQAGNVFGN
jgi:hypothetical protein